MNEICPYGEDQLQVKKMCVTSALPLLATVGTSMRARKLVGKHCVNKPPMLCQVVLILYL